MGQGEENEQFGWNQDSDPPPFDSSRCDVYSNTNFPPHLVTLKICKVEAGKNPHLRGPAAQTPVVQGSVVSRKLTPLDQNVT